MDDDFVSGKPSGWSNGVYLKLQALLRERAAAP